MNNKKVKYFFNEGDILIKKNCADELEIIKIISFGELFNNCFYYIHKKLLITKDKIFFYDKHISTITLIHEYYKKYNGKNITKFIRFFNK